LLESTSNSTAAMLWTLDLHYIFIEKTNCVGAKRDSTPLEYSNNLAMCQAQSV
ncbi:Protein of unknown function, partial [Gryllus bimaculatus]